MTAEAGALREKCAESLFPIDLKKMETMSAH
jgi:hypothetical protein